MSEIKETIIIIPALNEAKTIFDIVASIREEYPDYDVVVIDDGSEDETAALASDAGAFVISHPFNMGYGVTIQTGYKYALNYGYKYLVQIDGDGQHDIRDIRLLLNNLKERPCEIVFGSRFIGNHKYKPTIFKLIGIRFFCILVYLFTGNRVTDSTTGFQAMRQSVFKIFTKELFPYDYPDADIMILLAKLNIKMVEVPVRMYPNQEGSSMHSSMLNAIYYVFKMIISMSLTMLRKY